MRIFPRYFTVRTCVISLYELEASDAPDVRMAVGLLSILMTVAGMVPRIVIRIGEARILLVLEPFFGKGKDLRTAVRRLGPI